MSDCDTFFNELHANLLSFSEITCKILMSSSLFDTFRAKLCACHIPNKMPRAYKILNKRNNTTSIDKAFKNL